MVTWSKTPAVRNYSNILVQSTFTQTSVIKHVLTQTSVFTQTSVIKYLFLWKHLLSNICFYTNICYQTSVFTQTSVFKQPSIGFYSNVCFYTVKLSIFRLFTSTDLNCLSMTYTTMLSSKQRLLFGPTAWKYCTLQLFYPDNNSMSVLGETAKSMKSKSVWWKKKKENIFLWWTW